MPPVHVQHPVPVRCVARGARREGFYMARHVTPVELREVAASDVEHACRFDLGTALSITYTPGPGGVIGTRVAVRGGHNGAMDLYAHGGSLWQRLRGTPDWRDRSSDLTVDEFRRFLEGEHTHAFLGGTSIGDFFMRTPVLGMGCDQTLFTGTPFDPGMVRQVVDDGFAQAERDLRRFLREDVLVVDGLVHARLLGPIVMGSPNTGTGYSNPFPRRTMALIDDTECFRIDRAAAFAACMHREDPGRYVQVQAVVDAFKGAFPEAPRDDDVALLANHAPSHAMRHVASVARWARTKGVDGGGAAAQVAEAAIMPWLGRAQLGAIGEDEAEEALTAVLAGLDEVHCATPSDARPLCAVEMGRLSAQIRDYALPILHARSLTLDEDEAALTTLSLGR